MTDYHAIIFFNKSNGSTPYLRLPEDIIIRGGISKDGIVQTIKAVNAESLTDAAEQVYSYFNSDSRWNTHERSLSVGDIIRLEYRVDNKNFGVYMAVDLFGFRKVDPKDLINNIRGKIDYRVCCENAERNPCVCEISYKCPVHHQDNYYSCVGSHD